MLGALFRRLREVTALKTVRVRIIACTTLVVILSGLIYYTYNEYRKTTIVQQQQQMLGIARSISRSIDLFINEVINSSKIISLDKEFIKSISSSEQVDVVNGYDDKLRTYFEAHGDAVDSVYFLNKNGKVLLRYPQSVESITDVVKGDVDIAISKRKTHVGKVYLDKSKNIFMLNIYEPVFDGDNFKGLVSVAIRLDVIYDKLIAPVIVGEKGYALVKDQDGIIIMHQVKEQVGIDVIETRKQLHPELEFEELEVLIDHQLKGEEGTAIYHSYWWKETVLEKVKKLNAYTPVKFGEHFWVVAVTMSYDEIQGPINKFLAIVLGIVTLIIIIIYLFLSELFRMKRKKDRLVKETNYLKILNEASEQLRKKEAELYHSHKLKMIGTLAGGIAHDINNLLTPILGYSELLLMRLSKDSEYYEDVEEILKASQKGRDLIEQILLFSRNDSGIVKVEPINVNEVITETLKLVKAVLPKRVIIKEDIKRNCGHINANFTQIHQVIFNLCTNAYQAIKDNKGIIEISLNTIEGNEANNIDNSLHVERRYVELIVKDTGCGMDGETKERVFEPFFTTKDIGEGTGLGLFVVKSIIDKYEGVITLESEVGKGSCFKVYLPQIDEAVSIEDAEEFEDALYENKRILIVDDSEKNTKVLRKGLEHLGYKVVTETDSMKALEKFKSEYKKFDLVITDYIMPGLKGSEFAVQVKKIKEETGVILMTGYIDEGEEAISNNKCIDAYILKPIELAKISEIIRKVLADKS